MDPDGPDTASKVTFRLDDTVSITIVADVFNEDAKGNHGFEWLIPNQYRDENEHELEIFALDTQDSSFVKLNPKTLYFALSPKELRSCTFGEFVIPHGKIKRFFANSPVPYDKKCYANSEVPNDGVLSGSFVYPACFIESNPCVLNGVSIKEGENMTTYQASSLEKCVFETRICNSGILSGSFEFETCIPTKKDPILKENPMTEKENSDCSLYCSVISFFGSLFG